MVDNTKDTKNTKHDAAKTGKNADHKVAHRTHNADEKEFFQKQRDQKKDLDKGIDPHNPHPRFGGEGDASGEVLLNRTPETYENNDPAINESAGVNKDSTQDLYGNPKLPGQDNADATDKEAVEGTKPVDKDRLVNTKEAVKHAPEDTKNNVTEKDHVVTKGAK